jgi:hypothetical protein
MTKLAAGSLLRTIFSSADAGALRIAVKGRLNLQPPCGAVGGFLECAGFPLLAGHPRLHRAYQSGVKRTWPFAGSRFLGRYWV